MPRKIVLTLIFFSLPIGTTYANTGCTIEQLAGEYKSAYGAMECRAASGRLDCCYGNVRSCDKNLELTLSSRGNELTGKWIEGSQNGAARFAVTRDCSVSDGFWGNGRRATSPWSVTRVGQAKKAPAPTRGSAKATASRTAPAQSSSSSSSSQSDTATGMRIESALAALGYDPGQVDGVIDGNTRLAIVDWQRKTGHNATRGLSTRQLEYMEEQAVEARALAERRAQLESISPLARFNRRVERNEAVVLLDTKTRCEETGDPLVVIAESEAAIPESGRVLGALQNAISSMRSECRRNWRRFDVPVYTPAGAKLSERYMYMYKSGVILPYSVLTAEYLDFLSNDPGYPFARVAPPLINIASGLWEREFTRGGWSQSMGGDAHWQTIAFQFALADAQLCKNQVGKTVTYKHTITQQDEYTVDTTTVTYEFDADWEPIILQILANGNHIGIPMGTGAKHLIRTFGCDSEEVARLRRNPITVVAKTLGMPLPPGAGHVQQ
ncbi:peptidoglycan-binding domain-containing protein [Haliea sp.]|jgi:peptidoglycan hydrolase-like protein with peptidoglycan-binding domain|uniref:peptidoglycan-binding domain-containing protein n=1 Tax=Haliea TaxID=475794 RepID=UPI00257FF958|nr:peptidoglycan-binding domain-containing protein [Haliea sp.]|tara:strand:+ start:5396 stop:6883 length:1488 start_codon:yes stop_codon:yes gene_type:complete